MAFKIKFLLITMIVMIMLSLSVNYVYPQSPTPSPADEEAGDSLKRGPAKPIVVEGRNGKKTYIFWVETGKKTAGGDFDGDLLVLGSTLEVKGKVQGSIVAVGSFIILEPGTSVEGNMVLFASTQRMRHPDMVKGKIVEYDLGGGVYMAIFYFFLALKGLISMFLNNSDVLFAVLLMIFAKKRILGVCDFLVEKPSKSLLWGLVGLIVFIFLGMLLFATIYGGVLVIVLLAFAALLFATANASIAYLLGQVIEDKGWIGKREFIIKGFIGLIIIFLVQLGLGAIPYIGLFLSGIFGMIIRTAGTGAVLMAWFNKEKKV